MMYFRLFKPLFFVFSFFLLCSFTGAKKYCCKPRPLKLLSVHIVDRNGLSETISGKDRLEQFESVNFLDAQPYQKVLRIYKRDSRGNVRSVITTYYENGNPKQFLEILNGRANGNYFEWHENGVMSISTKVLGGTPDVISVSQKTWIFDGKSCAWDEDGALKAEISYSQGALDGPSIYYHPNGNVWKKIPFTKNLTEGVAEVFRPDGTLLQTTSFCQGQRNGESVRYWCEEKIASKEEFCKGKILSGEYFNLQGDLITEIKEGNGYRAVFGKSCVHELQQYENGILEGEVKVFGGENCLKRIYHVKNGIKHGEEIEYYDRFTASYPQQPRIAFNWYEGKVQGDVKTWYIDGSLESHKEMSNNVRHGVLSTWYRNGDLMMIEEYDNGLLVRGDYFKKGEKTSISQVAQKKGTATIYDADGHYVQKINYLNGKPEV